MLIRTSAPVRQIERMLDKRDWRRRLAARQTITSAEPPAETGVSRVAVIELGLAARPQRHRPARARQAVNRAPVLPDTLRLRVVRPHSDENPASPH